MKKLKWFAVKTLYVSNKKKYEGFLYEERVVLFKAKSLSHAIDLGEQEALKYESNWLNHKGERVSTKYTGLCESYELLLSPKEGREVFSSTSFYDKKLSKKELCKHKMGPELTETKKRRMRGIFF